jgi:hypothetical protein
MPSTALTENTIINNAYYLLEKASELWAVTSDEYLTARGLANIAINRWEMADSIKWKELFTTLTAAATGVKTLTAGVFTYAAPDNFRYPSSYVRTTDSGGGSSFWHVISPEKLVMYADSGQHVCWFTGNVMAGFTLNFNSYSVSLTTGHTINYEYYKQATLFTAITDTTEMEDPYFISYYIAAHMAEEGVDPDMNTMAEARLEAMRVQNMSQLFGVSDDIPTSGDFGSGFGF